MTPTPPALPSPEPFKELEESLQSTWDGLDNGQRLAAAWWLGRHLHDHLKDPGSFRTLIYSRFEFGAEAYVPLYLAGWLEVSNACHDAHAHDELVRRLSAAQQQAASASSNPSP